MKKLQIRLLIVLATVSFVACSDSPAIQISGKVDIYQDFSESGSVQYSTHVFYNANHNIAKTTVQHNGQTLTPNKIPDMTNWYYAEASGKSNIADALGSYTVNVTDTDGKTGKSNIVASFAKPLMGKLEVVSFENVLVDPDNEENPDKREIRARIRRQPGIDMYRFYIVLGNNKISLHNLLEGNATSNDADYVNISLPLDGPMKQNVTISVAAVQKLDEGEQYIIQRSITRTMRKGTEVFVEGNYPETGE